MKNLKTVSKTAEMINVITKFINDQCGSDVTVKPFRNISGAFTCVKKGSDKNKFIAYIHLKKKAIELDDEVILNRVNEKLIELNPYPYNGLGYICLGESYEQVKSKLNQMYEEKGVKGREDFYDIEQLDNYWIALD